MRLLGSGHPWSDVFYVTNVSAEPWWHSWQVTFESGVFSAGLQELQPGQSISVDVAELRDLQVPDENGETIPLDAQKGQINWSVWETGEVVHYH